VTILIVDDEPLDLFIAKTTLQGEFRVEGFTTMEEAVAWSSANDFDAILIDYYLGPDTYATHVLKALQALKPLPIRNAYVLSNYVNNAQASELRAAGFEGVIDKPISLTAVRRKLLPSS